MEFMRRLTSLLLLGAASACVGEQPGASPVVEAASRDSVAPAPADTVMARDTARVP